MDRLVYGKLEDLMNSSLHGDPKPLRNVHLVRSMVGCGVCFNDSFVMFQQNEIVNKKLDADILFTAFWIKHEYGQR